jgi:hypothetical protein
LSDYDRGDEHEGAELPSYCRPSSPDNPSDDRKNYSSYQPMIWQSETEAVMFRTSEMPIEVQCGSKQQTENSRLDFEHA